MQSVDDSFALVREARDPVELVADDAWTAEPDPADSDVVNTESTRPLKRPRARGRAGPQAVVHFSLCE